MPSTGFGGIAERFDLTKPVIAAVNGHAIGGGLEIVLACDLAISVSTAKFGCRRQGGARGSGGLHRLSRQLPMKWAMKIALAAELFPRPRISYGLINEVVDPGGLDQAVRRTTDQLRSSAPLSLRASKQMMPGRLDALSLVSAFRGHYPEYETMLTSEDAKEGSAAFIEKRARLAEPLGGPDVGVLRRVGDGASFTKTVSESDVRMYAGITGDFSPNYVNKTYMERSSYGGWRTVLMIGFMSTVSTKAIEHTRDSDETAVSLGYDRIRFLKPVHRRYGDRPVRGRGD